MNAAEMNTFEEMEKGVIEWASQRGILQNSTSKDQILKTTEELGETVRAILKRDLSGIVDGLGDMIVTQILAAKLEGYSLVDCLRCALIEIQKRKGKMVDGVFVKDNG